MRTSSNGGHDLQRARAEAHDLLLERVRGLDLDHGGQRRWRRGGESRRHLLRPHQAPAALVRVAGERAGARRVGLAQAGVGAPACYCSCPYCRCRCPFGRHPVWSHGASRTRAAKSPNVSPSTATAALLLTSSIGRRGRRRGPSLPEVLLVRVGVGGMQVCVWVLVGVGELMGVLMGASSSVAPPSSSSLFLLLAEVGRGAPASLVWWGLLLRHLPTPAGPRRLPLDRVVAPPPCCTCSSTSTSTPLEAVIRP